MKGYNLLLNTFATIIIGVAVIGVLAITYKFLNVEQPKTDTIKIEYHGVKTDSINEINKLEIKKIDSLLSEIKETSNNIQKRQLNLVEDKENDNFFNKLYAAIVAIILAIAGFFGFKSTNDIRSRSIEEAKYESTKIAEVSAKEAKADSIEIAKNSAKEEFNRIFDEEYKGEVFEQATKASSEVLRKEIGRLEKSIFKINARIEKLESKEVPEENTTDDPEPVIEDEINDDNVDQIIDDTKNPFDNE
ncbi:hypothetical protein [Nonlabens sp. Asnod3-A02]|uniref:hypothetical protein n=1 Tax=Nonlabens sp. Asnod3-A02 TaxID=3160579 RepID=UPI003867CCC4